MSWRTMDEWKSPDGPANGTEMLVLLPDGTRCVASFDGWCQRWKYSLTKECISARPVAWAAIPSVPFSLTKRNAFVAEARKQLDDLELADLRFTGNP